MAQIFRPSTNTLSKLSVVAPVVVLGLLAWMGYVYVRSPYFTDVGERRLQPVPFSHKHHVQGVGLDCRYCHASVEISSEAGMPPTSTCMTCHSQIWANSPALQPVRDSATSGRPLPWTTVTRVADYVYFNHGIHVQKGVACVSCHGHVEEMPVVAKAETMNMSFCLECHKHLDQPRLVNCYTCHR